MSTDATSTSSNISTLPLSTPSLTIVQFPPSLKLQSTNYMSWKTQIEALLQGLDLYKFIDGTHPPPSPTITDGLPVAHVDYPAWFRQDRLLFGALVGTLSPSIVPLITNASSSLEAWTILSNTYANPSRGHIKQLQYRLKLATKTADQTITDYMQAVKTIVDELSILGKKMDAEDITDTILNGLDSSSYKPVIDAVHARDTPISFHELHEKLINHELSLAHTAPAANNIHQPITAFAVNKRPVNRPWNNRQQHHAPPLLPTPQQPTNTRPFLGKCQFCFTKGHSLTSCYVFKHKYPHVPLPSFPKTNQHHVHVATTTNSHDKPDWLFDTGASDHVTNDLNTLALHNPYDGTDELVIGDGFPHSTNSAPRNG